MKPLTVSAAIPTFNSSKTVNILIESIQAQTYPIEEILVLDDASTDDTCSIAKKMNCHVHYNKKNEGRGYNRALGVTKATSNYVLFCDSTVTIESDFLEKAIVHFKNPNVGVVFGRLEDHTPSVNAVDIWRKRHLLGQEHNAPYCEWASLQTAAAVFNRQAVLEVGNFNIHLKQSEDRDLGQRLIKNGWKVIYDPTLKLHALTKNTLFEVLSRYWRWNCPSERPLTFLEYTRLVIYSIKVMCKQDIMKKNYICALISLFSPHYQFFKSWGNYFKNKAS